MAASASAAPENEQARPPRNPIPRKWGSWRADCDMMPRKPAEEIVK